MTYDMKIERLFDAPPEFVFDTIRGTKTGLSSLSLKLRPAAHSVSNTP